ncbi:MAG: endonuclease MutS2 [Oscillospiraceae bacterium]|nr:endonuclease MutS2 [Oscillospiraceae bacterium]
MKSSLLKYTKQLEFDKILTIISEYAVSPQAKDRIINHVPTPEYFDALRRMDMTEAIHQVMERHNLPGISSIDGIGDICMRATKNGMLSMAELLKVRTMLKNADALSSWYETSSDSQITDELFYMLYSDGQLENDITRAIISDTEMSDQASTELADIRRRITATENSIRDRLDGIIRADATRKILQDAIITMRNGRFVVPVKAESRGSLKGLVHDVSQSGATYFIEPDAVVEANNRIMELMNDEAREIERILFVFSERVAEAAVRLSESYTAFIEIDQLLAKAKYAIEIKGTRPNLNNDGYINLKNARHPLIPSGRVVPINISMGEGYKILVITGPNTGGKTVTLKTVGLMSLMAMSGILLPVDEHSNISVFDSVFADVGDEQSIEQNLSTFSGHITNIVEILKNATDKSLVLLDELGAGTDPAEGAALAIAILERLHAIGAKAIATTHYGEIKVYAVKTDMIANASCEFNLDTLQPTYKVIMGIPGSSNALHIAQKLGMDQELISMAKNNIDAGTRQFEDVLKEMEKLRLDISQRDIESKTLHKEANQTLEQALSDVAKKRIESDKEYEHAVTKSRQMSADVEAAAHKLLEEMRSLKDSDIERQKVIQRAREIAKKDSIHLVRTLGEMSGKSYDELQPLEAVEVGQTAFITSLAQTGQIMSLPDENGYVQVKSGNIRTRVLKDTLKQPEAEGNNQKKSKPKETVKINQSNERSSRNELNLLGKTVDEAIIETDRFIDQALMGKLSTIYLIHGKGTGRLRSALQQHLRSLKTVKRFRLGGYGEGDSGVTIVELERSNEKN